jgi:hypothetical protein
MTNKIVQFYADKLHKVPSGVLVLFFEALNEKGHKEVSIEYVELTKIDDLNSTAEIKYRAPYDKVPCEGGGGYYIKTKLYHFKCQHANSFSCTSSSIQKAY